MIPTMICWLLAMESGLSWAAQWTVILDLVTILVFTITEGRLLNQWNGWVQLAILGITPWLLAIQHMRDERLFKTQQAEEARELNHLSDRSRNLLSIQHQTQKTERQIAEITDAYHVTREASKTLRLTELFSILLDLAPRLLNVKTLRLIDLSTDRWQVLRAHQLPDGQIVMVGSSPDVPADYATQVPSQTERVIIQEAASMDHGYRDPIGWIQEGDSRFSWTPLWWNRQLSGVLVVESLAESQKKVLLMIANQLSLQLSRILLYQQVESLAVTDALTGLFVRRYFVERAKEELARAQHHDLPATLVMVDLDHFKQKNDTYGHLVGDIVLTEVAQLLQRNLREVDLIARYGGEEFILLLVETTLDQAVPVAERLRQIIELHPIRAYDELLSQTVSLGIAGFPRDGQTLEALIEKADEALYAAKKAGRNRLMGSHL